MFILISACNDNFKKYRDVGNNRIYELQCDGKYYLSLEDCTCNNLPKNYFVPNGDENDRFYVFYAREENSKVNIYTLYQNFEYFGDINRKVNFHISQDNSEFMDFIKQKNLIVFKGYSNGKMKP